MKLLFHSPVSLVMLKVSQGAFMVFSTMQVTAKCNLFNLKVDAKPRYFLEVSVIIVHAISITFSKR